MDRSVKEKQDEVREEIKRQRKPHDEEVKRKMRKTAEMLTGPRKLFNQMLEETIDVPFHLPNGEQFKIDIHPLSRSLLDEVLDIQLKTFNLAEKLGRRDPEALKQRKEMNSRLYEILGEICADPTLDHTYWEGGKYPPHIPTAIIAAAIKASLDRNEEVSREITFFRRKPAGATAPPTM